MAYGIDPNILNQLKTFSDYNQMDEDFQLKKQLAIQSAIKSQLETQALQQQAANGGITAKDLLGFQIAQQNHSDTVANQRLQREDRLSQNEINNDLRRQTIDVQKGKIEDKQDLKFKNDQNALTGILQGTDEQIAKIDALFTPDGKLKPEVASVYGTVAGYQLPAVHQSTIDARTNVDNIINNSIFQKLGELKAQSATGASGLGSLSDSEGRMLKSSSTAAADYKQSPEQATKNLKAYREQLARSRANFTSGFSNIYGNQAAPAAAPVGIPQGGVLFGTSGGKPVYKLPDGTFVMEQ